tara:strand:+ start:2680 stop:3921 length:1242 start_codon:yes stop_codon:yes gene_type:complete
MKNLEKIVEGIEINNLKKNFYKNEKLFKVVEKFIKKNKLILYGGYALNLILPKNKKFYKKYTESDFDCYSYNALNMAYKLGNILKKNNYKYIKIKKAKHEKTYKVYVGTVNVVDFSQIEKKIYNIFLSLHKIEKKKLIYKDDFILIPMALLKRNLHYEISRPDGSYYRWEKIDKRLKLFEESYFPNKKVKKKNFTKIPENILKCKNMLLDYIKKNKNPIIDIYAIKLLKNIKNINCCRFNKYSYLLQILSTTYKKTVKNIIDIVNKTVNKNKYKIIIIRKPNTSSYIDILKVRTRIQLLDLENNNFINLISIVKVKNNCFSVQNKNGFVLGSYDTILCFLYSYYISYLISSNIDKNRITSTLKDTQYNINFYERLIKNVGTKKRYLKKCYGKELSKEDIYKKNWFKRLSLLKI